jgi:hypothetical protein
MVIHGHYLNKKFGCLDKEPNPTNAKLTATQLSMMFELFTQIFINDSDSMAI